MTVAAEPTISKNAYGWPVAGAMKTLAFVVGLFGAAIVASLPPEFSNDSQYYIQSGILWARGDVTYAGTLIGSRIFAVLYYYWPQIIFGRSIDAVSLSLGITFVMYAAIIVVWCFDEISSAYGAACIALFLIVAGFAWLPWRFPLTEQLAIVVALGVLYLLVLVNRSRASARWLILIAAAAISGLGTGVRSELALLLPLIVCAVIFEFSRRLKERLSLIASMVFVFVVALQITPLVFSAFSGKQMPSQIPSYFLFFQAIHILGDAKNGPSSQELSKLGLKARSLLTIPVTTSDARLGIGPSVAANGSKETDRLAWNAGIETLRAKPLAFTKIVVGALSEYLLYAPGSITFDLRSYDQRWSESEGGIRAVDAYRAASSERFGGDSTFPVASLFEHRLSSLSNVMGGLPTISVVPPSWLITTIAIVAILLAAWSKTPVCPSLIAAIYFLGCVALASISQGYIVRYFLTASLPLFVTFTIDISRRLFRLRKREALY